MARTPICRLLRVLQQKLKITLSKRFNSRVRFAARSLAETRYYSHAYNSANTLLYGSELRGSGRQTRHRPRDLSDISTRIEIGTQKGIYFLATTRKKFIARFHLLRCASLRDSGHGGGECRLWQPEIALAKIVAPGRHRAEP